jgi:hypothetical protein
VSLEFAFDDDHHLALQGVLDQPVLSCYGLALRAFHKLCTQNHDVSAVLDEDAIT